MARGARASALPARRRGSHARTAFLASKYKPPALKEIREIITIHMHCILLLYSIHEMGNFQNDVAVCRSIFQYRPCWIFVRIIEAFEVLDQHLARDSGFIVSEYVTCKGQSLLSYLNGEVKRRVPRHLLDLPPCDGG